MDRLSMIFSGFTGAADRFGNIGLQILEDRLELLSLEMREAKIRFVQALLLTCMGVVFSLLGILLLVLTTLYLLPPELRLYGLTVSAVVSMFAALLTFILLRRHLERKPLAFDQSVAELKKDTTCFSTRS